MQLVFVHGWSVVHTNTYGDLPRSLADAAGDHGLDLNIAHVHLSRYISFHDEVSLDDIARAFDAALRELPGNGGGIQPFSAVTHSTGGPVVRHWLERFYGARRLAEAPLEHLVMLAPANHGSSLAVLGKGRLGRIKAWFGGIEPGQRVLDWLCLGSEGQWQLNEAFLRYQPSRHGFFPFVLTGQGIDANFYDFLNSYLVENGSDGVVRVCGANINHRFLHLVQTTEVLDEPGEKRRLYRLRPDIRRAVRTTPSVPLGVFGSLSHSGRDMGIMRLKPRHPDFPRVVDEVLRCLAVTDAEDYQARKRELDLLTSTEQARIPVGKSDHVSRYSMLVFRVTDHAGNVIPHRDYDLFLLGGPEYRKDELPRGFFVDRQMNTASDSLVYYVDADKMALVEDGQWGIQVVARPEDGFSYYAAAEFRSEGLDVSAAMTPNETTYVEIQLRRRVDRNVFRLGPATDRPARFDRTRPGGEEIDQ